MNNQPISEEINLEIGSVLEFHELIQHGINNGANIINGMPWSWKINGKSITHENNDRYIVDTIDGIKYFDRYESQRLRVFWNGLRLSDWQLDRTHAPGSCPL